MPKNKDEDIISRAVDFLESEAHYFGDFRVDVAPNLENEVKNEEDSDTIVDTDTTAPKSPEPEQQAPATSGNLFKKESGGSTNDNQNTNEPDTNHSTNDPIAACKTLVELKNLCTENIALKTDLKNTNLVFGVGNPDADLMIIGEAPGFNEDKQGEPFVGKAGQLLNKILDAIGFKREDVYIANILKHRPPNNRNPSSEERQRSLPYLKRQIELINPKLILCLGKVSANTLLDNASSLSNMRSKFHPFMEDIELMATYHPAALLRNKKWKYPTWEDVQKLRKRYDQLVDN